MGLSKSWVLLCGKVTPKERANEWYSYCNRHLKEQHFNEEIHNRLYRIFYYDCPSLVFIIEPFRNYSKTLPVDS